MGYTPQKASTEGEEMVTLSKVKIKVESLNFWFGEYHCLKSVNLDIPENCITAIMGPSGCGKSTFLRCLNRMNELYPNARMKGRVLLDGEDIYSEKVDPSQLRKRVGMVFQKPNPLPKSIFENVAYGLRIHGIKRDIEERVEKALKDAALWDEVKEKLHRSAFELSGGQQQRLCIARCLALEPEVLLLDEPASALDPISTAKLEELLASLKRRYTIVIVTHNLQQAARVSDFTAFMYLGEIVEFGTTGEIFTRPKDPRTERYLTGKFG